MRNPNPSFSLALITTLIRHCHDNQESTERLELPILETVVVEEGEIRRWFFTAKEGLVRTKGMDKLVWNKVLRDMTKSARGTILTLF